MYGHARGIILRTRSSGEVRGGIYGRQNERIKTAMVWACAEKSVDAPVRRYERSNVGLCRRILEVGRKVLGEDN